jgi:hypothetical protein
MVILAQSEIAKAQRREADRERARATKAELAARLAADQERRARVIADEQLASMKEALKRDKGGGFESLALRQNGDLAVAGGKLRELAVGFVPVEVRHDP